MTPAASADRSQPFESPSFTVDTHLFTELGELLVGRDSTALVELVKNAYDADARTVSVFAEGLGDRDRGIIRVVDNGTGMTAAEFSAGFLRIAAQTKQERDRRSKVYGRRYTGAKGIGRLAAHKLARQVLVDSVAGPTQGSGARSGVHAVIDWDVVERHASLSDLPGTGAIRVESAPLAPGSSTGTAIELQHLRGAWSSEERNLFLAEMQSFQPPRVLTEALPARLLPGRLLLSKVIVRDSTAKDPGMEVEFQGDFALAEEQWLVVAEQASWILEIDARRDEGVVEYALAPTASTKSEHAHASRLRFKVDHPDPASGPFFQARILCREGAWPRAVKETNLLRRSFGIRVYLEGFRVLPYGESGNDWLGVDAQYTTRGRKLPELETFVGLDPVKDEGLASLPNSNYFGAVFLTHVGAPKLQMLINREGFIPDPSLDGMQHLVRMGLDLLTRARAHISLEARTGRRRRRIGEGKRGLGGAISDSIIRATAFAREARTDMAEGNTASAAVKIAAAATEVEAVDRLARELISEAALIRVLASLGTQMAAFIHETNGLLGAVTSIETALKRMEEDGSLELRVRYELGTLLRTASDLRVRLERQGAYLTDVVSADARRRRMRLSLANRFQAAIRLFAVTIERQSLGVETDLAEDLTAPPMFPAELLTVLTNLLSNAIKAAGHSGRIKATGFVARDGHVHFILSNSGEKVDLTQAEHLFAPYVSTSPTIESALGQGMGLGLTITRSLLAEYGAEVHFVATSKPFATAIEVVWPPES
jgi:signal transduction histidine kinase